MKKVIIGRKIKLLVIPPGAKVHEKSKYERNIKETKGIWYTPFQKSFLIGVVAFLTTYSIKKLQIS